MKGKTKSRVCHIIDMTHAPYIVFGVGIKKRNPKRCLNCGKSIRRGEEWRADTSAEDPEGYGRYTLITHSPICPDQKAARKELQDRFAKKST